MVIKKRSSCDSTFDVYINNKHTVPYGNMPIKKYAACGYVASKRDQSHTPVFLESVKQPNKIRSVGLILSILVKISLFVLLCYHIFSLYDNLTERDMLIRDIRTDLENAELTLEQNHAKIEKAQARSISLKYQIRDLLSEKEREAISDGKELSADLMYQKIVDRQSAMVIRVNELQRGMALIYRGQAEEHFGYGPHRVQFNIRVDDGFASFTVQLATLELMPHCVNYFLRMVDAKVWDNTVFNHGKSHILYSELTDIDGNDRHNQLKDANVPNQLSFPEYSTLYQHNKYTIGFSGRPGGPGFYINLHDNTHTHGPGGQIEHTLHEEADPCFGVVVEGHDVIDLMETKNEKGQGYTAIDSIRIVK